jgi:hypothetical protein
VLGEPASGSYAVDWTDQETWSRPPPKKRAENPEPAPDPEPADRDTKQPTARDSDSDSDSDSEDDDQRCADPEASWGHRRGNHPEHDYPSPEHRESYNRRSAAERTYATIKDPATNDINKGWCRIIGLTAIAMFTATVLIARNLRIADAFAARQAENERRAANGLPPKRRKRRRHTTQDLISAAHAPP